MFKTIGTEYGGWPINLDLVPRGSYIIAAGIGEDISFDVGMIAALGCHIIGVDPTPKSHRYVESQKNLQNYTLIKKALHSNSTDLLRMYKNKRNDHVSESILTDHTSVNDFDYYHSETIDLGSLFETYTNVSVVKMDVEGSEYEILTALESVPASVKQFCVEFHHFCSDKTIEDTKDMFNKMSQLGFPNHIQNPSCHQQLAEITFWRE